MSILIVGDYYTAAEETERIPFAGSNAWLLKEMLNDADIDLTSVSYDCAFPIKPPVVRDFTSLCVPKKDGAPGFPGLANGKYLPQSLLHFLDSLVLRINEVNPNVIVAAGAAACWALLGSAKIAQLRGTVALSTLCPGRKVIPIYSPSRIASEYKYKPITILDLAKAKRESASPTFHRPERELWLDPTLTDLKTFYDSHIASAEYLSVDIETAGRQITCIGFAPSRRLAIVIPFVDQRAGGNSYWQSSAEELRAWEWVRKYLQSPAKKVTQNGLYDFNFLWTEYGLTPTAWTDDTMLMHHALYIESQKGLGFLGSIYTNEPSWKLMRDKGLMTIKKGDGE